jgi:hypothetical protein
LKPQRKEKTMNDERDVLVFRGEKGAALFKQLAERAPDLFEAALMNHEVVFIGLCWTHEDVTARFEQRLEEDGVAATEDEVDQLVVDACDYVERSRGKEKLDALIDEAVQVGLTIYRREKERKRE